MTKNSGNADAWINKLLEELVHQQDRMLVLIAGQMVDESLRHMIEKFLVPKRCSDAELLKNSRPLGEFSSRINISHQLGLISEGFARDLTILSKMRNECAHTIDDLNLETEVLSQRIKEIYAHVSKSIEVGIKALLRKHGIDENGLRAKFMGAVFRMLMVIGDKTENLTPLIKAESEKY
ncbi:hypothetical protein ACJJIX_19935 [Microbulbifer sp. VAAC004]|uniref:hypothetical protein n=1 Tax=unclassified Microbulbifer TaxID=2619833 RepID=UPI0040398C09